MSRGGKRPGAGRPRGGDGLTHSVALPVRCSPEQLERWKAAADARGLSLAAWVRLRLDSAAGISVFD